MRTGRIAIVTILVGLLASCSRAGALRRDALPPEEWERTIRRLGADPAGLANPLASTEAMRRAAGALAGGGNSLERLSRLQSSLFEWSQSPFNYDAGETLTAAEAFEKRRGNCLSFTNLFIAMARSLGLSVTAADIRRAAGTKREGDLVLVDTHVAAAFEHEQGVTLYDLSQSRDEQASILHLLDDLEITAAFANNRGVEELRQGRLDSAARYLDASVRLAPDFAAAYGNLGVVRRRMGDIKGAIAAYQRALASEPGNPTVLENLAALYASLGLPREARAALAAADLGAASPLVLIVLGDLEAAQGNLTKALAIYRRANRKAPKLLGAMLAIARTELSLGHTRAAQRAARKVLALAPDNDEARGLAEPRKSPADPK